jgi:small subunit ribosomal protein S11
MAEQKENAVETPAPSGGAEPAPGGEAAAAAGEAAPPAAKKVKSRSTKSVPVGIANIRATFNNTQVSITDLRGGVVAWSSSGRAGFKGSRKSTAFAATMVGQDAAKQAIGRGMRDVEVRVQGAGAGREPAIRALQAAGLTVTLIRDITPIPHNGCRPRKRRRV